jgi:hypothetical protein
MSVILRICTGKFGSSRVPFPGVFNAGKPYFPGVLRLHNPEAAEERTQVAAPLDWAVSQHGLSSALRVLGERETGTNRLEEAVSAAQRALSQRTRDRFPMDWAASEVSLGHCTKVAGGAPV